MSNPQNTPPQQPVIDQRLLETCMRNADIARKVFIEKVAISLPDSSESQLAADIGGKIFNRCLDGQRMNFRTH